MLDKKKKSLFFSWFFIILSHHLLLHSAGVKVTHHSLKKCCCRSVGIHDSAPGWRWVRWWWWWCVGDILHATCIAWGYHFPSSLRRPSIKVISHGEASWKYLSTGHLYTGSAWIHFIIRSFDEQGEESLLLLSSDWLVGQLRLVNHSLLMCKFSF